QLCAGCHGVRGDGSGEWAYRVTPRPRDLTSARVQNRSDGFLFSAISDGLIGTPMLGWKDQLSQRQRWQIVGYLRHLGAQAAAQTRIGT
ncbi:MAG: cytochrome c, partial [Gammaproteobacteria bacterium]|nr:cytochrome c [Gammaproteobacteria bacterium]NIQ74981.1 cytochrome c [Gammaproteobacteria bacterium]NIW09416.1 c-type cytochrome [Gammaproteobacteria bacterium]